MKREVMIVDDDPSILFTVRKILEREGFEVATAGNGRECLEKLKRGFKGVILMDITMPGMDGWDTIRAIIGEGYIEKNVLAISMLTAREAPDQKMEGLQEYVIGYITKPFEPAQLVASVKKYFV